MRIILIIAVAMLGLGNEAFAQAAPKEVVVVDGQIAVNNFPASQTVDGTVEVSNNPLNPASVMVENGVMNPVPTLDVSSEGEPFIITFFGSETGQGDFSTASYAPPAPVKISGVSVRLAGDPDASFAFTLRTSHAIDTQGGSTATVSGVFHLGEPHEFPLGVGAKEGSVTKEFTDLPITRQAPSTIKVIAARERPDGATHTVNSVANVTLWGYYVNQGQ